MRPECAPASFRNPCPSAAGTGAQVAPEYAHGLRRILGAVGARSAFDAASIRTADRLRRVTRRACARRRQTTSQASPVLANGRGARTLPVASAPHHGVGPGWRSSVPSVGARWPHAPELVGPFEVAVLACRAVGVRLAVSRLHRLASSSGDGKSQYQDREASQSRTSPPGAWPRDQWPTEPSALRVRGRSERRQRGPVRRRQS
jgi:hypothetical protein